MRKKEKKIMIIGTRGSKLAILQTEKVRKRLKELGYEPLIKAVRSLGDVMTDRGLYEMPEKGVFVKKLDMLLLQGKIDLAVHSMKDIPLERDERLETSAVLPRDSPYDALVSKYRLDEMPEGAVIGTSSVRRKFQFLNCMDSRGVEVTIKDIRGNVDTRIKKFRRGEYDGVILAEAGLKRLNAAADIDYERLDCDPFVPSPNQGIIAVVTRKGSEESEILKAVDDPKTRMEAEVENEVLEVIGGGCSLPVGVHAHHTKGSEDKIELAVYISVSRERHVLEKMVLSKDKRLEEARDFAERLPRWKEIK
ncbi:hydroxymethylbilane synthase [Methanosarcinales archaeon]|nr:MAG: hydroxymethylbilane synthase [Methanosarcinales archaeon]